MEKVYPEHYNVMATEILKNVRPEGRIKSKQGEEGQHFNREERLLLGCYAVWLF
jgi:hypothetical protein